MRRFLKFLAILTSVDLLLVLVGGSLVTETGSSQGCGHSWPLCNGQIIPHPLTINTVIELSHRLVSGSAGILVLLLCILSWKMIGHVKETKLLAVLSLLFLVAQALIGAAAVVWGQSAMVLALHFGISLISFASVALLTLLIFEVDKKFDAHSIVLDKKMKFHIYGSTIYTYIVVYTGALVRHEKATLACTSFPFCGTKSPFTTHLQEFVQMGHRFAALLLFVWIFYAMILAIREYKQQRIIYLGWSNAFILVSLQAIVGMLIIYSNGLLAIKLLHNLVIAGLFSVLCYLCLLATRSISR
ncbi:COX15/CtaA family protein [Ectobacillus polymachus]|uniref:COX15/CtaA family protein n=1 Tax=Ectobacillus polymachus TaxID=1508806 RepID=UPI003A8BD261